MDTREQNPFDFSRFEGWFADVEKEALKIGDCFIEELRYVIEAKITLTSHLYHYHWLEADDFGRLLADEDP